MANNLQSIPFHLLEKITDNFSEERKVGKGGFGEVYKGIYKGEDIAVKKLFPVAAANNKEFNNELFNLISIQHQNIIKLVGYCYEVQGQVAQYEGIHVLAEVQQRVLCFDYFPLGSLHEHLSDESGGLDWHTRYKIIVGICEGLNFLHNGPKGPVYHLDLKPENILLDKSWMPKIGDFGLSRLINSTKSHNTVHVIGTRPFMPPEYIEKGQISEKYDVFSLGVTIIQIIAGLEGYTKYTEMTSEAFTELVHMNWRRRIEGTSKHVEEYCQQVKKCIKIASDCVEHDQDKRPTIRSIIHTLEQIETVTHRTAEEEKREQEQLEQIETMIHRTVVEEQKEEQEQEKSQVLKYGPWGGNGGTAHDTEAASSHRLQSVTIRYGDIIDSLEFSYSDHSGHEHFVGPWGGSGANKYTIKLEPSEFLTEISGKFGPYPLSCSNVITSLMLVTNEDRYGPFGFVEGTPFRTQLKSNWAIVGFFARAERYVHKIGVYARPNRSTLDAEELAVSSELEGGQE